MVIAKKYQFKDFVRGRFFCFVGTWAMAITSLKDTIRTAVMTISTYMWPANMAVKKPDIMARVHIVRVINVAFFFSYSDCSAGFSIFSADPFLLESRSLVGLGGSDELSLAVEELWRLWSLLLLLLERCWNLTPFCRGMIVDVLRSMRSLRQIRRYQPARVWKIMASSGTAKSRGEEGLLRSARAGSGLPSAEGTRLSTGTAERQVRGNQITTGIMREWQRREKSPVKLGMDGQGDDGCKSDPLIEDKKPVQAKS